MSRPSSALGRAALAVGLVVLPIACVFAALLCGRFAISPAEALAALGQGATGAAAQVLRALGLPGAPVDLGAGTEACTIVLSMRLPRAIAAAAVGAALAVSGAAYQGVFRNPLVNPGLLGVSNGAGFGAALAIVAVGGGAAVYPSAFLFGVAAVATSWWIARVYRSAPTIMLILGGTVVSSVFAALVSLLKYVADPETQLPSIVYWLMGSLSQVRWEHLWALVPMAAGTVVLLACAWRIDVLSMGDKEARTLGLNVAADKALVVEGATLATAGAVCLAGVVGWVGLVIPHIGRMLVGSGNRSLMPAAASLGAAFLVVVDTASRCLWAAEVPLGILTALIGAPFFVYLLKRTRAGGWQ